MRSKLVTLRNHQRRFGWRRAAQLLVAQPLEDAHVLRIGLVFAVDLENTPPPLSAEPTAAEGRSGSLTVRDLETSELEELAGRSADWFFPEAVRTSIERADRCTAVMVDGQVACSMWSTTKPLVQFGLTLAPPERGFIGYRLFTRPEFRGRRLQARLRREIARRMRDEGHRWWINTMYVTNHGSIHAARALGFTPVGRITVVGPDRLCRRWLHSYAAPALHAL